MRSIRLCMEEYTALVIGAGASKPYGLPLGVELRDQVAKLRPTQHLERILAVSNLDRNDLVQFQQSLKHSGEPTVDKFIDRRPEYSILGKTAMAVCLLKAENPIRLQAGDCPKDHWLEKLWARIRKDSWSDFKKTRLRIINFNYDRLVEYYLTMVLCSNFLIRPSQAFEWITNEMIVHPHGTLGLGEIRTLDDIIAFGEAFSESRIYAARQSMFTIQDAEEQSREFNHARSILKQSKSIVFAGFGYHDENMKRMGFPDLMDILNLPNFFASRKGLTLAEWNNLCYKYFPGGASSAKTFPTLSRLIMNCGI